MRESGFPITKLIVLGLYMLTLSLAFTLPKTSRHAPGKSPGPASAAGQEVLTPFISAIDGTVLASVQMPEEPFSDQYRCLAQAIYFEARSEPVQGQAAVAQVVLNRVASARYPSTICGVVFQNERRRHRCQFSFACDGRSDNPREWDAWQRARRVAMLVLTRDVKDFSADATHYHATYVKPYWAARLQATARVGSHVFYRE